jgi:rubrerythrin
MQKTLENLTKAFIGESQARNRYSYYASVAKKEGFEQIAGIFLETAEQEKAHAKRLFENIQILKEKIGGDLSEIKVEASAPTVYATTVENLKAAIEGEHYETSEMYPEFAKIAEEEGLPAIAHMLESIAKAEAHHEERYQKLVELVANGTIFKRSEETIWICRECGFVFVGNEPPAKCPACAHPRGYYQVKSENY